MKTRSTLGRVVILVVIALGVTLALLPTLATAFQRNLQATQITRSLANATVPGKLCEITTAGVEPRATACADPRVCYLQQARANLVGQWNAAPTGTDVLSAYQAGYAAWCSGAREQAVKHWTPYHEQIANHFAAMGFAALSSGDADTALDWFQAGESLGPSAATLSGLGQAYHARQELERALTEFDAALALSPNDLNTLRHAAFTAMDAREYARAQGYCERALALDSNDWLLWQVLGSALSAQNLWAQAESAFSHVVALNPTYSHGNAGLGGALAHQGKYEQARPYFMNVIASETSDRQKGGYLAAYAALLANGGDHRGAVEFYRRASDFDPQNLGFAAELLKQFVLTRDCVGMQAWLAERRAQGFTGLQEPACTP